MHDNEESQYRSKHYDTIVCTGNFVHIYGECTTGTSYIRPHSSKHVTCWHLLLSCRLGCKDAGCGTITVVLDAGCGAITVVLTVVLYNSNKQVEQYIAIYGTHTASRLIISDDVYSYLRKHCRKSDRR